MLNTLIKLNWIIYQEINIFHYLYQALTISWTAFSIDLLSSPWISSCSSGLADPGTFLTHKWEICLIWVNALPHTIS